MNSSPSEDSKIMRISQGGKTLSKSVDVISSITMRAIYLHSSIELEHNTTDVEVGGLSPDVDTNAVNK